MTIKRLSPMVVLSLIMMVGLVARLINIGFGLPAMYDPDEPLFVLKAFKLLNEHTLNPGWFGHPGSTTIYLLAAVDVLVVVGGVVTGRFHSVAQFAAAVYAHPGLIFVPSRLTMVLIAVGTIWLTFFIARRLFGTGTALLAAAFLAVNAVHIAWSQVIRTDIHASLFMLAAVLFAIRAAEDGRDLDFVLAGLFVGFATATKWPGASAIVAGIGATLHQAHLTRSPRRLLRQLGLLALAAIAGLFIASPFIFLDWRTVVANVSGEVSTGHLGHSGAGFLSNLGWYLRSQIAGSMGWLGLALTIAGLLLSSRHAVARSTLLPVTLLFLVMISAQQQIWSRWITPALPMLAIVAALATRSVANWISDRAPADYRAALTLGIGGLALLPSLTASVAGARERANDTRDQASAWARTHIPAGKTIVVEHLALDLRTQPWRILFPIGAVGCVDGRQILKSGVRVEEVQKARQGSSIVDLGNVPLDRLDSCKADYSILTYYDLYKAEANSYPRQLESYRALIGSGRTVALFSPEPGHAGGPVTRIVALK